MAHWLRDADLALLRATSRLPHSAGSNHWVSIFSDLGRGAGWAGLSALLAARGGSQERRLAVRTVAAMLVANFVAQGPLKRAFRRRRPFLDIEDHLVIGPRTPDHSFPSGHTASSFAAATSLAVGRPRWAPVLILVAGAVGLSRVYLGHHYVTDVVGGAAVGATIATVAALVA